MPSKPNATVSARTHHAVAVDLGASSVRFAEGRLEGGRITFQVAKQVPNDPIDTDWGPAWCVDTLLGICKDAEIYAATLPGATIGIDSWGVDHGFIGADGALIQPPAIYRHPLHSQVFDELKDLRPELYGFTGIQHQPFNTLYQLIARFRQNPALHAPGVRWLILPELLNHLLGAPSGHELTQASTTQLLGLDGKWSPQAFGIAGLPVPDVQPEVPGRVLGTTEKGVPVVRVGGHDTASAVCGIGPLEEHQAFLSAGTWSLLGAIVDLPIATPEAEAANLTNERAVDGRIRFLDNIPGFFVPNRLHADLGISEPISTWLAGADLGVGQRIDLFDPALFNPDSMQEAVADQLGSRPGTSEEWAGLALLSMVDTTIQQLDVIQGITGRRFSELRVVGGGSASASFCQLLAERSGREVLAGPQEATVLGNLGMQFLAQGAFSSHEEMSRAIGASIEVRRFAP